MSILYYGLADWGLCSELINLIKAKIYADKYGYILIVDDLLWNNGNLNDFFESGKNYINKRNDTTITFIHREDIMCHKPTSYGKPCFKGISNKDVWTDIYDSCPSLHEMKFFARNIFILNQTIMKELLLTKSYPLIPYIGVHVRRGDKLVSEAKEISSNVYVDEIMKHSVINNIFHIYFASDDTNFVNEIIEKLKTKNSNFTFEHTMCNIEGHDQLIYNKLPKEQKKEKMMNLIYDIQRLIKSKIFICTFSSNISRFVVLFRRDNSYSLDIPWHPF